MDLTKPRLKNYIMIGLLTEILIDLYRFMQERPEQLHTNSIAIANGNYT